MITVVGANQTIRDLARMAALLDRASARAVFREAAAMVRDEARNQAPRGSGTLKRSIISFLGKRKGGRSRELSSYARVNVLSGRVKAPHGLLVERGRGAVLPKNKKVLAMRIGRRVIFTRRAGPTVPNNYWERAVARTERRVVEFVLGGLSRIVGSEAV